MMITDDLTFESSCMCFFVYVVTFFVLLSTVNNVAGKSIVPVHDIPA